MEHLFQDTENERGNRKMKIRAYKEKTNNKTVAINSNISVVNSNLIVLWPERMMFMIMNL